jgi:hypothetical protein
LKPKKKEQVHVMQDEEEGLLLLVTAILTCLEVSSTPGSTMEAISSGVKIKLKEEKLYTHLDEGKECDARTWVSDTGATNHMSGCQVAFMKLDTAVLGTVHFNDNSVV